MTLIPDFFSEKNIIKKNGNKKIKFNLISSFAIFYDVDNPVSFCKDIESLLDDDGIWICEFSYLPLMLKNLTFDQICHEHLTYYDFTVFEKIINKNGLKVIDYKLNEINGGSIDVVISKNNSKRKVNIKSITKLKNDEKKINNKSYKNFENRINKSRTDLKTFLDKNYPIIGYGASTKGNIVLNYNKLGTNKIAYICDANVKKYGKFTPGTNIKIISKEKMRTLNPKFLLVLIWSFRSEIIKQEINYIKKGGNLVFHLPKFHIINKNNYIKYSNKSFKELSYKY
jgi:NDP-4-keto-2,6-dideoxyhexose 3-C-methyltransferase